MLSEGYLSEIAKISNAQIYLPLNKKIDYKKFGHLNLSREYFGKIFSILSSKQNAFFYSEFDLFDKVFKEKKYKFENVYCAIIVFEELGFIKIDRSNGFRIIINKKEKKELSLSNIYNKLLLLGKLSKEG